MNYTKKILYQSNYWYNDGLRKAQIRDMSGAIASLRRSLQYNRANIASRNLLGLVYYGRGEVAEGLVEWIISKNLKPRDNVADSFIKRVQESSAELDVINQAVKRYNQCLIYCSQNGEDLAVIQLKKVVLSHPSFLKAYQLLALLYLHTEQYAKARQIIRAARKLDTTNEMTLRYMHEMANLQGKRSKGEKKKPEDSVEYSLGNETIIQPKNTVIKALAGKFTVMNIVVGAVIGAAIVWFLIVPAANQANANSVSRQIVEYSERINAMEAQISAQTRTLNQYRDNDQNTQQAARDAAGTADSYENLMTVSGQYNSGNYTDDVMADKLLAVNRNVLGEGGQAKYDELSQKIFPGASQTLYAAGKASLNVANYKTAIDSLDKVVRMNESYDSGGALLNLGVAYLKNGDNDNAAAKLKRVIELFPNTDNATEAQNNLNTIPQNGSGDKDKKAQDKKEKDKKTKDKKDKKKKNTGQPDNSQAAGGGQTDNNQAGGGQTDNNQAAGGQTDNNQADNGQAAGNGQTDNGEAAGNGQTDNAQAAGTQTDNGQNAQ